ncbi:MAG: hypothetical protein WAO55_06850 [Candidatus Manganitrophaceae bacterium]
MKIMKIVRLAVTVWFISFLGCASINLRNYTPVDLQKAEVLPSKSEISGEKHKVYLETLKGPDRHQGTQADLDKILQSVVERILLETGNVVFVSSDEQATYRVESQLATATLGSSNVPTRKGEIISSSKLPIPQGDITVYHADISGVIKVYDGNKGNLRKVFPFQDNSSERTQTTTNRDTILNEAISDSIVHGAGDQLSQFFSPKGYVIAGKREGGDYAFEVTLGGDRLRMGDQLEVRTIERTENPLTKEIEENDRVIATAIIVDNSGSLRSWVRVQKNGDQIRLGDYVRFVPQNGFSKKWNDFTKGTTSFIRKIGK